MGINFVKVIFLCIGISEIMYLSLKFLVCSRRSWS